YGLVDAGRDAVAPGVDAARRSQLLRPRLLADIASGGDARGQRVALAVEAAGVAQPARRTQAQLRPPARAGAQLVAPRGFVRPVVFVPGQAQLRSAQEFRKRRIVIDAKPEARAPRLGLGQADDATADAEVRPLMLRRQLRTQRRRGMQAAEREPGHRRT